MSGERLKLNKIDSNPADLSPPITESLAGLYANVFAGDPWNEYSVCPATGDFFGTTVQWGEPCPNEECDATLEPAYPLDQTVQYIRGELSRTDATLFLLNDLNQNDEIVGFSWGFSYDSSEAFARDKYKTPEMQSTVVNLLGQLSLGQSGLWYLSESGIKNSPEYRGKGLSREFHQRRLLTARNLGLDAIQRTNAFGNMYRTSKRTMTQIMGTETIADPTTGLLVPTGVIVNDVDDSELAARVLFANNYSVPDNT